MFLWHCAQYNIERGARLQWTHKQHFKVLFHKSHLIIYRNCENSKTDLPCFWSNDLLTDWVGCAVNTRSTVWFLRASNTSSGDLLSWQTSLFRVSSMSDSVVAEFSSAKSPLFSFCLLRYAIWTSSAKFARISMCDNDLVVTMESSGSNRANRFPISSSCLGSSVRSYSAANS